MLTKALIFLMTGLTCVGCGEPYSQIEARHRARFEQALDGYELELDTAIQQLEAVQLQVGAP